MNNCNDKSMPVIPCGILQKIKGNTVPENIGRSGAWVLISDDSVLKITERGKGLLRERDAMCFLEGKLNVPAVLDFETDGEYDFLLMSRMEGKMACNCGLSNEHTAVMLARGIKAVMAVDVSDCPLPDAECDDLDAAKKNIENRNVAAKDFGDFRDASSLYEYLCAHKPAARYFSHGDFCLPNVFLQSGGECGFIDLGGAGKGGKWRDISMCLWSMRYNFDGQNISSFDTAKMRDYEYAFFDELEISPCAEKINYYLLLGLLF